MLAGVGAGSGGGRTQPGSWQMNRLWEDKEGGPFSLDSRVKGRWPEQTQTAGPQGWGGPNKPLQGPKSIPSLTSYKITKFQSSFLEGWT